MKLILLILLMAVSGGARGQEATLHSDAVLFDKYDLKIVRSIAGGDTLYYVQFKNDKYDHITDLKSFRLRANELKNLADAISTLSQDNISYVAGDLIVVRQLGKPVIMGLGEASGFKQLTPEQADEIRKAVYEKIKFPG